MVITTAVSSPAAASTMTGCPFHRLEARQAELRHIVTQSLPATIDEALVIGVDQRTPQQFDVQPGDGEAQLSVRTSWEGDGTVVRDSALLPERVSYPTSFATHDATSTTPRPRTS